MKVTTEGRQKHNNQDTVWFNTGIVNGMENGLQGDWWRDH